MLLIDIIIEPSFQIFDDEFESYQSTVHSAVQLYLVMSSLITEGPQ